MFPERIVELLFVKFGDPSCIGFSDIVRKIQTDIHVERHIEANAGKNPIPRLPSAWVISNIVLSLVCTNFTNFLDNLLSTNIHKLYTNLFRCSAQDIKYVFIISYKIKLELSKT